jgi:hypothetical protein
MKYAFCATLVAFVILFGVCVAAQNRAHYDGSTTFNSPSSCSICDPT